MAAAVPENMSDTDTKDDAKAIEQVTTEKSEETGEQQAEKKQVSLGQQGCSVAVLSWSTLLHSRCLMLHPGS